MVSVAPGSTIIVIRLRRGAREFVRQNKLIAVIIITIIIVGCSPSKFACEYRAWLSSSRVVAAIITIHCVCLRCRSNTIEFVLPRVRRAAELQLAAVRILPLARPRAARLPASR